MAQSFWQYHLTAWSSNGSRHGALCLGERIKKGTYRSTITTIPYSQITGALRAALHLPKEDAAQIHAVGKFTNLDPLEDHLMTVSMSLRRRGSNVAQIPIDTMVLVDAEGDVFVEVNEITKAWDKNRTAIVIKMGAYRNKGLGRCRLQFARRVEATESKRGLLATRIPENHLQRFGIALPVEKPIYGYLFEPDASYTTGKYVRAMFEESIVVGPRFLLEE